MVYVGGGGGVGNSVSIHTFNSILPLPVILHPYKDIHKGEGLPEWVTRGGGGEQALKRDEIKPGEGEGMEEGLEQTTTLDPCE